MPWRAPDMWKGGDCWIIGGGSSMPRQLHVHEHIVKGVCQGKLPPDEYSPYLSALHMRHVIGVNDAFLLGDWVDVLFFGDNSTYKQHKSSLARWAGIKVSCASELMDKTDETGIKYVAKDPKKRTGITANPRCISWNANSGAASISLARHFGVKRIYLLGFDMCADDSGSTHWHDRNGEKHAPPFEKHMLGFDAIAEDAKSMGIEIINCSPESKLTQFPRVAVADVLGGC